MSAVPVQKPIVVTRPKPELRIEQGARQSILTSVAAKCVALCVLTVSTYFLSSLAGQVMVEKARRDGLRAVARAKDASKEEGLLRNEVQVLTHDSTIDAWAKENGFVSPEDQALGALSASEGQ